MSTPHATSPHESPLAWGVERSLKESAGFDDTIEAAYKSEGPKLVRLSQSDEVTKMREWSNEADELMVS